MFSKKSGLFSFGGNGNRKETGRVFGRNVEFLFVYVGVGCGKGRRAVVEVEFQNDLLSGISIQVEGRKHAVAFIDQPASAGGRVSCPSF